MTHYGGATSGENPNSMLPPPGANRRQLRTAGNPIGILDQTDGASMRRSMGGATSAFGPASRSGLRTSAEHERKRRRLPADGSQSGITASTFPPQKHGVFGGGRSRY